MTCPLQIAATSRLQFLGDFLGSGVSGSVSLRTENLQPIVFTPKISTQDKSVSRDLSRTYAAHRALSSR
jgi:hypothetical protein